jgi:hypothetical protein
MKKIMFAAATLLGLSFIATSCNKDEYNDYPDLIVGTWQVVKQEAYALNGDMLFSNTDDNNYYVFTADGKVYNVENPSIRGDYAINGNSLTYSLPVMVTAIIRKLNGVNMQLEQRSVASFGKASRGITYYKKVANIQEEIQEDGLVAVDLGLSVKWSPVNLGAENEYDYGSRYAWGETETKVTYTWDNYKWCNGSSYTMTKYCTSSSYGKVDEITVLEDIDDVARKEMGNKWRMPTPEEAQELLDECTWEKDTVNGVKGYRVTGKNANSIFIPLNGQHDESGVQYAGVNLYIWLNRCNGRDKGYVLSQTGVSTNNDRHDGLAIRAVCK